MPNKRLPMRKIKEVLRLKYVCGLSEREIAQSCQVTRSTVGNSLRRAAAAKVTWQMAEGLNETELQASLFPVLHSPTTVTRLLPDCEYIYNELRAHCKVNLTLTQLWLEYREYHPDVY